MLLGRGAIACEDDGRAGERFERLVKARAKLGHMPHDATSAEA